MNSAGEAKDARAITRLAPVLLALVAVATSPGTIADWLPGTYTASREDVITGAWILKGIAVTLCAMALAIDRLPVGENADHDTRPASRRTWLLMAVVTLLAVALRVWHLDTELWLDEIFMRVRYVPLEFRQLLSVYDSQNHQPLYSLLARVSWLAAGGTDWAVRVPAVLFGVASVVLTWRFARSVTSEPEAVLAALLLAVSYHHVWFSQNARGYTAMLCLTIPATGLFLGLCRGIRRPRLAAWGYGCLMALATYTHLTAALIAIGHAAALLMTTPWLATPGWRRATWPVTALLLSATLTVMLYAPMLPQVLREVTQPTMQGVDVEWTGVRWMLGEGLRVLASGIPGGLLTVAVALVVLGIGMTSYWRQSSVVALLMLLPIVATLVAVLSARHNLWPRFFFFSAAFIVMAALRGGFVAVRWAVRWRPKAVAIAGATGVAAASLVTVPRAWVPKQHFRAAHAYVERERQPGDLAIAVDMAHQVYFLEGLSSGWGFTMQEEVLADAERTARRTWVVYTLPMRLRAIAPGLHQRLSSPLYEVVKVFPATVGGGEIYVVRHEALPSPKRIP